MLLSIITVCYNSEKFIKHAIESVLNQDYPNIEYIIVDGGSSDNTLNIVKSYGSKITKIISEPDKGIFDAMNKGISLASGDIIGMLNSDDLYLDNKVISKVVESFKTYACKIIYGDLVYVKKDDINCIVRRWITKEYKQAAFKKGWHPPHPTLFVTKDTYELFGNFKLKFNLAADFEIMLRFIEKEKLKSYYLPQTLVKMRMGGASNKGIKSIFRQNIDCYKAFEENGIDVSILYPIYRLIPKIKQLIVERFKK